MRVLPGHVKGGVAKDSLHEEGVHALLLGSRREEVAEGVNLRQLRRADGLRDSHELLAHALLRELAHVSEEGSQGSRGLLLVLRSGFTRLVRELLKAEEKSSARCEGLARFLITFNELAVQEEETLASPLSKLFEKTFKLWKDRKAALSLGFDLPEHPWLGTNENPSFFQDNVGDKEMREFPDSETVKREEEEDRLLPGIAGLEESSLLLCGEDPGLNPVAFEDLLDREGAERVLRVGRQVAPLLGPVEGGPAHIEDELDAGRPIGLSLALLRPVPRSRLATEPLHEVLNQGGAHLISSQALEVLLREALEVLQGRTVAVNGSDGKPLDSFAEVEEAGNQLPNRYLSEAERRGASLRYAGRHLARHHAGCVQVPKNLSPDGAPGLTVVEEIVPAPLVDRYPAYPGNLDVADVAGAGKASVSFWPGRVLVFHGKGSRWSEKFSQILSQNPLLELIPKCNSCQSKALGNQKNKWRRERDTPGAFS